MQTIRLTIKEAALSVQRRYGGSPCPDWALRRIVDELDTNGALSVQRVGRYRTISADDIDIVADELRRRGRLDDEVSP